MSLIFSLLLKSLVIFLVAEFLPGIYIKHFGTAVIVAVVYTIVNFIIGKVLYFFAFPLIIVTLGLFTFVISAFLLWITDKLVEDFKISNLETTLYAAFIITVSNTLLNWIFF